MKEKIIDGKLVASKIKAKITAEINNIKMNNYRTPKLCVIQVGNNVASSTYIKNKKIACEKVGILFSLLKYPATITEKELIEHIMTLNNDPDVDGILVQLPLPDHIDTNKIIDAIDVLKDVDGFSSHVLGNLMINKTKVVPATPKGIMSLFNYYNIDLVGQHVVIVGRSNIVGKPLANLTINAHATVTVCHSKTNNLSYYTKQADILVMAVGKPKMLTKEMIKENVIIIDVGTNRDKNNKLCGDVYFDDVYSKVKMISPVPGGVGPMTIASLLENIMHLYELHNK
ncbi:hypothetical protein P344_04525 [Spiroplasma mirum ATCC 29335]|uniref:Bifunctional protein FolD n=1 Tax=Spiroplasma mirum ATCC 29335 TaxID=838561 RepID=W0GRA4_9MOLU|nr:MULTISPECIES: bifunctional 5,10-methylenetetrahydrofolate dehydrogenase/5,10-methenyltetrahydrofolate cyclohydrolase [Spiroplasma]AHF61159.1 bifunctional methylenetetrahydrofolate dehydrogenase/methenyltetrahydrofolate cyclohydrolase [Spiroplasma mirum ATCC 29335]AHI58227.1 hypothetical protein P344_04525 [Spiroplasma mirum ATCC 29335]AKM53261.1 methylenetetrahydrofolate dehydrogenase/methylenetetrahydrofolate cyclohydrolase [Spiroplasma atrichopogonis]